MFMIGLEFIINIDKISSTELSDKLGIAKQNISRWISGDRKIPQKYLPLLEQIFNLPQEYFQKELNLLEMTTIARKNLQSEVNFQPVIEKFLSTGLNEQEMLKMFQVKYLRNQEELLVVMDDIYKLMDSDIDFLDMDFIIDAFKSMVEITRLEKMDVNVLNHILDTILHNKPSKNSENDEYIKSFKKRGLSEEEIILEKKTLEIIRSWEDRELRLEKEAKEEED
jgi:transcriptional regulator with XRE-family HTH domain